MRRECSRWMVFDGVCARAVLVWGSKQMARAIPKWDVSKRHEESSTKRSEGTKDSGIQSVFSLEKIRTWLIFSI